MSKTFINIKTGDDIILWNGSRGYIIATDKEKYQIKIQSPVSIPQWFHIVDIKSVNGIEIENGTPINFID
ncbi:MAG: hypothetical protein ACOCVF_01295 [bacterium]